MLVIHKRPLANADLLECWLYIAKENSPQIADKVLLEIDETLKMLANNPNAGRLRPELGDNLRSFPVSSFILFYTHDSKQLDLIRLLHGAMDVKQHI